MMRPFCVSCYAAERNALGLAQTEVFENVIHVLVAAAG